MQGTVVPGASVKIGRGVLRALAAAKAEDPQAFQSEREAFARECYGMSWADAQRVPAEEAAKIVARWMARVLGGGKGAAQVGKA